MGEKIGQGRDNVRLLLKQDKKLALEIENKIRTHYGFKELSYDLPDEGVKDSKKSDK